MDDGQLILAGGALLSAGLIASLVAVRVRVPSLVVFLGVGMIIGWLWIDFDDYELARSVGIVALALILFEGGLNSGFLEIRPVLPAALSLALVGTVLTAVIAGLAAALLFDLSTLEGLLLGAILSATDGAAIFALLRGSTLRRRLARALEGESGFNDPVAVFLVIGFIEWIETPGYGIFDLLGLFAMEMSIGLVAGVVVGWLAVQGFQRAQLATSGLYPVGSLATAALSFGVADTLHGSGFLAVYIAGLMLGSANVPAKATVAAFHDGLGWVAQLVMFLTLGLLVFPEQLGDVAFEGTVLAQIIVFIARPLAAWVATVPFGFQPREQLLLGWAGLRGAVPVVLATFPVIDDVEHSLDFFNIVFFAVVLSTILQGSTMEPLAARLGLTTSDPTVPQPRPPRRVNARHPIFSSWRWNEERDGDPQIPGRVRGEECIAHIRIRRDEPGGLWALADGRYAVTGPMAAVGGRDDLSQWARRRMRRASPDERAWLMTVVGALAADLPE